MREQRDDRIHGGPRDDQEPWAAAAAAAETPEITDDDPTIRMRRLTPSSSPLPLPSTLSPIAPPAPPAPPMSPPLQRPPIAPRARPPAAHRATDGSRGMGARRVKRVRAIVFGIVAVIAVASGMLFALTAGGREFVSVGRSAGQVARQATSTPRPTPTATLVPLPDFGLPAFCGTSSGASQAGCVQCPYTYDQTQYSRTQVQQALDFAADQYDLPRPLVYAIAWGESNWHSGFITCNYDLGVMQLKQGYLASFDGLHEPPAWCPGIERTLYDPIGSMQENVLLGAKWLAWLRCYYGWMASSGGSRTAPDADTLAWYYQQAGKTLPDTSAAASLCASTAQDQSKPWFKDLGTAATDLWSCPFSATAGDRTFLDVVVAGYNGGPQVINGTIPNDGYVSYIEGIMTQFAQGQLPA